MPTEFLDLAKIGKHQWRTYLLGWVFILTAAGGVSRLRNFVLCSGADPQAVAHGAIFQAIYHQIYWLAYHVNFSTLSIVLSVFLVVRLLYQRPIRRILTANNRLNWNFFAQGFALYFLFLLITATLTEYMLGGSSFGSGIKLPQVSVVATTALIVGRIIVSAAAEEVFLRGYMLQGLGLLTGNRILLASASGILFMVQHLPLVELNNMLFLLACFEMGFYLTIVTLKSNGLELAIGMHIAHNFAVTLVPHITAYQQVHFTIFFPICAVIMYLILFRRTAMPYPETKEPENMVRSFHPTSE
jgi:uncharacterized protein